MCPPRNFGGQAILLGLLIAAFWLHLSVWLTIAVASGQDVWREPTIAQVEKFADVTKTSNQF